MFVHYGIGLSVHPPTKTLRRGNYGLSVWSDEITLKGLAVLLKRCTGDIQNWRPYSTHGKKANIPIKDIQGPEHHLHF